MPVKASGSPAEWRDWHCCVSISLEKFLQMGLKATLPLLFPSNSAVAMAMHSPGSRYRKLWNAVAQGG